jgi:hypothetical protein
MPHKNKVGDILRGSFDFNVHSQPDPEDKLRMDALDTGRHAHEAGMAGFVLKSHYYPTTALADALNRIYPGLGVSGSITLNREVGGLNPYAVNTAAETGARVVSMPTLSADFWLNRSGLGQGLKLLGKSGHVVTPIREILGTIATHNMVLGSGNISPKECISLFIAAKESGVNRLVVTNPVGVATQDEIYQIMSLGAYVEISLLSCSQSRTPNTSTNLIDTIKTLGSDQCIITTAFGHWTNPPPAEGMRMAIAQLLNAGLEPNIVESVVKTNPIKLLSDN